MKESYPSDESLLLTTTGRPLRFFEGVELPDKSNTELLS